MGMMMLHAYFYENVIKRKGIFCREIFRMQIISNYLGPQIEEALIMLDALLKWAAARDVTE